MVGQAQPGQQLEVFGKPLGKAVPSPESGAFPWRSHSHQSEAGAAPSHWVDDAPVPHMNSIGQCTAS
jgi:hypothetical protein